MSKCDHLYKEVKACSCHYEMKTLEAERDRLAQELKNQQFCYEKEKAALKADIQGHRGDKQALEKMVVLADKDRDAWRAKAEKLAETTGNCISFLDMLRSSGKEIGKWFNQQNIPRITEESIGTHTVKERGFVTAEDTNYSNIPDALTHLKSKLGPLLRKLYSTERLSSPLHVNDVTLNLKDASSMDITMIIRSLMMLNGCALNAMDSFIDENKKAKEVLAEFEKGK